MHLRQGSSGRSGVERMDFRNQKRNKSSGCNDVMISWGKEKSQGSYFIILVKSR